MIIVTLALYHGCPMITLCSYGQGTTSDLSFNLDSNLDRVCRGSASMLFWIMYIFSAGVSFLRDTLVKRGPSEGCR